MDKVGEVALSRDKTRAWKQETGYCFQVPPLGSPLCCVTFIKFRHLSWGVKNGGSPSKEWEGAALRGVVKAPLKLS